MQLLVERQAGSFGSSPLKIPLPPQLGVALAILVWLGQTAGRLMPPQWRKHGAH